MSQNHVGDRRPARFVRFDKDDGHRRTLRSIFADAGQEFGGKRGFDGDAVGFPVLAVGGGTVTFGETFGT